MNDVVKAAAHPTRQAILRSLEERPRTTTELEEALGANRYHLYHHLAVLERAALVRARADGKSKEYSLLKPSKPEAIYLELNADFADEKDKLADLLKVVHEVSDGKIPHLDQVIRARLMLSYSWTPERDG